MSSSNTTIAERFPAPGNAVYDRNSDIHNAGLSVFEADVLDPYPALFTLSACVSQLSSFVFEIALYIIIIVSKNS